MSNKDKKPKVFLPFMVAGGKHGQRGKSSTQLASPQTSAEKERERERERCECVMCAFECVCVSQSKGGISEECKQCKCEWGRRQKWCTSMQEQKKKRGKKISSLLTKQGKQSEWPTWWGMTEEGKRQRRGKRKGWGPNNREGLQTMPARSSTQEEDRQLKNRTGGRNDSGLGERLLLLLPALRLQMVAVVWKSWCISLFILSVTFCFLCISFVYYVIIQISGP